MSWVMNKQRFELKFSILVVLLFNLLASDNSKGLRELPDL